MNTQQLESQFSAMGARFKSRVLENDRRTATDFAIDIQRDRRGAFFELRLFPGPSGRVETEVLQVRPRERHLLLLVRRNQPRPVLDRFLCGHDEREWFVAAVPEAVSTVSDAMESLKPAPVLVAQVQAQLTARQRHARKNRAFRRQGEWFFVPAPGLSPDPKRILRDEPIRRGQGKPHWVEQLYREGGQRVYVCRRHPNGIPEAEYQRLIRDHPSKARWNWRLMQRDAAVYARGDIRHPDHRTITLPDWHQVVMNTETRSRTMGQVAFLD